MVIAGAAASGRSTWAATHFAADQIVSSDRLRAVVGTGEDDMAATADACALLDSSTGIRPGASRPS